MSLSIKKDDMVIVLSGDDKGVRGRVLSVDRKRGKAIVEGVNIIKKHQKARSQTEPGGILEQEAPIALCKLMLLEPSGLGSNVETLRAARFGVKIDTNGAKSRVLKIRNEPKEITV